jgi:hypothetical protein
VRDDGDALLRTGVEPLEELHGAFAAMIVGLALVGVKDVLVVPDFRKVKVWKLGGNIVNGASAVTDVVPVEYRREVVRGCSSNNGLLEFATVTYPQRSRHSSRTRMRGAGTRIPALNSGVLGGACP